MNKNWINHIVKWTSPKYMASQARLPKGIFGKKVLAQLFIQGNAHLNAHMLTSLDAIEGDVVLEIGPGPGEVLKQLCETVCANYTGKIVGIDLSSDMVSYIQTHLSRYIEDQRLDILEGSVLSLPFEDGEFDKICTANTIYFWDDLVKGFEECRRVLREDGKLVIAFRPKEQAENFPFTKYGFNLYTKKELKIAAFQAGFETITFSDDESQELHSICMVCS